MPARVRSKKSTDNASFYSMFDRHCCTLSIDKVTERRAQWNKYTKQTRQSLWKLNWLFVDVKFTQFSVDFSLRVFLWLFCYGCRFLRSNKSFVFVKTVIDIHRCHSVGNVYTVYVYTYCTCVQLYNQQPHLMMKFSKRRYLDFVLLLALRNDVYVSWNYCILLYSRNFFAVF